VLFGSLLDSCMYSLSIFISDLKWFSFWFFSREFCSVFPIIPLLIFSLSKESNYLNGIWWLEFFRFSKESFLTLLFTVSGNCLWVWTLVSDVFNISLRLMLIFLGISVSWLSELEVIWAEVCLSISSVMFRFALY